MLGSPEYNDHRLIIGYHGCDRSVAEKLLLQKTSLKPSSNPYDWLGEGVYFWEHGPKRALDFASEQKIRGKIEDPFVVGAYLRLGRCLDLTDVQATKRLGDFFPRWEKLMNKAGLELPINKRAGAEDDDLLLRFLDCAVLNAFMTYVDWEHTQTFDETPDSGYYQSVRGVFVEGEPVFPGSKIYTKTHIQITVRDPRCILGYFSPNLKLKES